MRDELKRKSVRREEERESIIHKAKSEDLLCVKHTGDVKCDCDANVK